MYTVYDYGRMMCDETRMKAFLGALERCVKPGCTVADLGTGTGIFALVAAKLGARHVYAIDPNNAIEVGKEVARENGLADRVTFFRAMSTEVELPEKVDVIVSDMRGQLPVSSTNLPSLADARDRFLAPGGVMIPLRDRLFASLVDAPDLYANLIAAWEPGRFHGLVHGAAKRSVLQSTYADHASPIDAPQMLMPGAAWADIDYATQASRTIQGRVERKVTRKGTAHGLCVWFESTTCEGITYSTGPAPDSMVYARMFMPLLEPVAVDAGDELTLLLRADPAGTEHTWTWETTLRRGGERLASFRQSTFLGEPMSREDFQHAADDFAPTRSARADAWREVLQRMDGHATTKELATYLADKYPNLYRTLSDALAEIKQLDRRLRT